nr:TfuA-like protein [Rhizobium sp. CG5]
MPQASEFAGPDLEIRPPACQGDVMRAVADGATVIGLIDAQFEYVTPVWHKELLFALSNNIQVFGAASMGALRAAECAPFGMIGIGRIFEDFISGRRVDDADVALSHGPAELNYLALSVPIVSVDSTLEQVCELRLLSAQRCSEIAAAARSVFFKDRSWKRIAQAAGLDWAALRPIIEQAWVDQKRLDALELLGRLNGQTAATALQRAWRFNATPLWRKLYPSGQDL